MSELKRRTPEEVELWYLGKIASMTVEIMDIKAHAVEVLSRKIAFLLVLSGSYEGDIDQDEKLSLAGFAGSDLENLAVLKARALLGWEE